MTTTAAAARLSFDDHDPVTSVLIDGEASAWTLAAMALAGGDEPDPALRRAADDVVAAAGLLGADDRLRPTVTDGTPAQIGSQAAATVLQAAAVVAGGAAPWAAQSDASLLAQGHASAQGAKAFAMLGLPQLGDLAHRLARPGARVLDVGTGVGALAVAYAERFPAARVVGIDVLPRALALAARTVAESTVAHRLEVRDADVATFVDEDGFDLAWVPAPFIPPVALTAGVARLRHAVRPGGWVVIGHGKVTGDPSLDALTRFKTVAALGGTVLDHISAAALLTDAGFAEVRAVPTPPGSPGITVGRVA